MKLYTNGCSFTQGTYPFTHEENICQTYNGYEYNAEKQDFVWPWVLGKHFDFVFNHGKMATGFDRVVRTTLEFIECLDPKEYDEWIFVLEPTMPERKEYIYDDGKIGQVSLPLSPEQDTVVFFHTHDHDLDFIHQLSFEDVPSKALLEYHLLFQNPNSLRYDQYRNLLLLQGVLQSKGIKYLYCPLMTYNAILTHPQDNIDCINGLVNMLDSERIITSMTRILNGGPGPDTFDTRHYIPNDNHPNEIGNQLIADYMKKEMEKRNWLT